MGVFDVTWPLDADVAFNLPHAIQGGGNILGGGAGAIPEVVVLGVPPAPGTPAAQRLGAVAVSSVDATNVVLSKTNAGGSSPIVTRVIVARKSAQLSAVNTAIMSAVVGMVGGSDD